MELIVNYILIVIFDNVKMRIYEGDKFVLVFGNCYVMDVFEGRIIGFEEFYMMIGGGMVGMVECWYCFVKLFMWV